MTIKVDIDSHIQLPKSTLVRFSKPHSFTNSQGLPESFKGVYCLQKNGVIELQDIDNVNVEYGYFENEIECELSKIESRFMGAKQSIIKRVNALTKSKKLDNYKYFGISSEDLLAVYKYCSICFVRSPIFVKYVNDSAFSMKIGLYENAPQNIVMMHYFNNANEIDDLFKNMGLSVLINHSSVNFILPQMGILFPNNIFDLQACVAIPITPKMVAVLERPYPQDLDIGTICEIGENEVDKFNKLMIKDELLSNVGNIYAQREQDILRYKEFYTPRITK